jgi:hypothetical protein
MADLTNAYRNFWGEFACNQSPEYEFTFNFVRPYSDAESIDAFKFVMRAIQKKIPSSREIRGVAVLERTWKNAHFEGCLHLHSLLWGINANIRSPDEYIRNLVERCVLRLVDTRGRQMGDLHNISLQRIHAPQGIAAYVTKDINIGNAQRRSKILLVTRNGLSA